MVRCPDTWDQRGLVARTGTRSGLSGLRWNQRMGPDGSDPVRWISARRAGIASLQAYVFHRSSRRARVRVRSLVLAEMGPMTDGRPFCSGYLPRARRIEGVRDRRKLGRFTAQRLRDRCLRDDVTGRGPRADEDSGAGGEAFVQCHLRGVSCASGGRRSRTRKAGRPRGLNVWFSDSSETRRLSCS